MRRDLRGEAVTIHILLSLGKAALEQREAHAYLAYAQQPDNLLRVLMGQVLHICDAAGGEWTGEHHKTYSRHTQRRCADVCGPGKGTGDNAD